MLSCAEIGRSSWRYYQKTVTGGACDYFLGHGDAPGRWHGAGLPQLGLTTGAIVVEQQLEALFGRALSPSMEARLGRGWAAAAVTASLDYLQTHVAKSRRGRGGIEQVDTAGFTAAVFDHRTSRTGDPQLHSHCLVVNKVLCQDGVWRSVDGHEIYHHLKSGTAIYQAALRAELSARLPVVFGPVTANGHADIVGVPDELISLWSTRRTAALAVAVSTISDAEADLGREVTAQERAHIIDAAVLTTRPAKEVAPAEGDVRTQWRDQAAALGWDRDRLQAAVATAALGDASAASATRRTGAETDAPGTAPATSPAPTDLRASASGDPTGEPDVTVMSEWRDRVITDAVTAVGRTKAIWSRADLAAHIAARVPHSRERVHDDGTARASASATDANPRTAADLVRLVEDLTDRALATDGLGALSFGPHHDGPTPRVTDARYASAELVAAEARIMERMMTTAFRIPAVGWPHVVDRTLAGTHLTLSTGQRAAAVRLVGSQDQVTVVTAPAGAGKTTMLAAAVQLWHVNHTNVITLAPSARAASELAAATGTTGRTVASWLLQQHHLDDDPDAGQDTRPGRLSRATVVVVDEASMLSTADLDQLTARVHAVGAALVLVGDPAQIGAVNAPGGMFETLTHRLGPWAVELTELHRYHQKWEADATLRLRSGDTTVLPDYAAHGRIHPAATSDDAADAVFTQWHAATTANRDALMLARSWTDVTALNARARAVGVATGQITGPDLVTVTSRTASTGGRSERRSWRAGDILITKKNNTQLKIGADPVRNGDRFQVTGAGPDGSLIVTDVSGRGSTLLPRDYLARHTEYGWATTIDGAQGATADIGIVLARSGLDREHLYVAMSRGRYENHVHTTTELVDSDAGPHREHPVLATARPQSNQATGQLELLPPDGVGTQRIQPPPVRTPGGDLNAALAQLAVAVRTSGRERSAHSLLDQPVAEAREHAWRLREAAIPPRRVPEDHQCRITELHVAHQRREVAEKRIGDTRDQLRQLQVQIDSLPFYARHQRQDLTATITSTQHQLSTCMNELEDSEETLTTLTGDVAADSHQRQVNETKDREHRRAQRTRALAGPLSTYRDPYTIGELHEPQLRDKRDGGLDSRRPHRPTPSNPAHYDHYRPPTPTPPTAHHDRSRWTLVTTPRNDRPLLDTGQVLPRFPGINHARGANCGGSGAHLFSSTHFIRSGEPPAPGQTP